MQKTIKEKLHSKKITRPNFIYNLLGWVWKNFVAKKYNVKYNFKIDKKQIKGPCFFISNHASRLDYIFTGVPLLPNRFNYVAGYNEFFRSHLAGVFGLLKVIPKRNFMPDMYAVKEINRIIKNGGNVLFFPEGMNSISGANQPVVVGTGKFIKHYKVPVYYSVIKGAYLTSPKYNLKDRVGTIEVDIDQMFTIEQLEKLSPQEIEDTINTKLYHDDFKWNKQKQYTYDIGTNAAEGLETLLFWCPKCKRQHFIETKGNTIYCSKCKNGATITNTYDFIPFNEKCVIPETQTEWFNMQREAIKKEVKKPDFVLKEKVKLGMLPDYKMLKNQATSQIVGEGILTLNSKGLKYKGTKNNEKFEFFIDIKDLPTYGMCTDITRFYTFYNGDFMEFFPQNNVVEKFFLATEELHRLNGGKWQDFKYKK